MFNHAMKRRKVAGQTVNFSGPISGGTINIIGNSEVDFASDGGFFVFFL